MEPNEYQNSSINNSELEPAILGNSLIHSGTDPFGLGGVTSANTTAIVPITEELEPLNLSSFITEHLFNPLGMEIDGGGVEPQFHLSTQSYSIDSGETNHDSLLGQGLAVNNEAAHSWQKEINYPWVLSQALGEVTDSLTHFLNRPEHLELLTTAFGDTGEISAAPQLIRDWLDGKADTELVILPEEQLEAHGAFSFQNNTIYLSADFIAQNLDHPEAISLVILEEIGHWLDAQLHEQDSSGDEGEIFAALVKGRDLSSPQLQSLKQQEDHGTITTESGTYEVEYSQGTGLTGYYFNNKNFTDLQFIRTDAEVDFNWGTAAPAQGMGVNTFSVRWEGQVEAVYDEIYTFYTGTDDGARLWVNGQLLIDNWSSQSYTENSAIIALEAGEKYDIRLEYYDQWGSARARLAWKSASQNKQIIPTSQLYPQENAPGGTGTGLQGEYFDNIDLSDLKLERLDEEIRFENSFPSQLEPDTFSARWTGQVEALYSETYTFYTGSDDGARLWVDGQLVVDNWNGEFQNLASGTIHLEAGEKYDLRMEYFNDQGYAEAWLAWGSSSQINEYIPTSLLYPELSGDDTGVLVPGEEGQTLTATIRATSREATQANEFGLFKVDDQYGRIGNLKPGDAGYSAAALSDERRIEVLRNNQAETIIELESNQYLGTYLIGDGTTESFLAQNPDNIAGNGPLAFFSFKKANPDGAVHVNATDNGENGFALDWEDMLGGGDGDFNDLMVDISFGLPSLQLRESATDFAVEDTRIIDLGATPGITSLSFDLNSQFDTSDTTTVIKDQLLVYLLDQNNQTLLGRVEVDEQGNEISVPGTALFSLAGETAEFTPGLVRYDGTTVDIDLTSLQETNLESAQLVFQLLNHDGDTGTTVSIGEINPIVEGGDNQQSRPLLPETNNLVSPGEALPWQNLENSAGIADINLRADLTNVDYNGGQYRGQLRIQNLGQEITPGTDPSQISPQVFDYRQVAVVFTNLPNRVELVNRSGFDSNGNPYINLSNGIFSAGLEKGNFSEGVEVILNNPNNLPLNLTTQVWVGGKNQAPVLDPVVINPIMPGQRVAIPLVANDPDGDRVTFNIISDGDLPTGTLKGNGTLEFNPTPSEIGSYEFTVIASDGLVETSQTVTLEVVGDPITSTRISGQIMTFNLNSEGEYEEVPLENVEVELGGLTVTTDSLGYFTWETDLSLADLATNSGESVDTLLVHGDRITGEEVYPFIAEKLPLLLFQDLYEGYNNVIDRPIYLPALDIDNAQPINSNGDTTVAVEVIPGAAEAEVFVAQGTLLDQQGNTFEGNLSITQVPNELTPAALPENLVPDLVVTIQPGEMEFTTPAPLTLPNLAGYEPGTVMDLWSINPNTGDFDIVGVGRISDDGTVVETIEGGIINSSWHFFGGSGGGGGNGTGLERGEDEDLHLFICSCSKETESFNSDVELHSGAVIETHNLVSYQSNGTSRGLTLTYDSLRADPRPIVHFASSQAQQNNFQYLIANLEINRGNFSYQVPGAKESVANFSPGNHYWALGNGQTVNAALQADLSFAPSGKYEYDALAGYYRAQNLTRNILSPLVVLTGSSDSLQGDIIHVNSIDSPFGSGWGLAGLQELVENPDGSVLFIDGNGTELIFEAPEAEGEDYIAPPGFFSSLRKLADGTFQHTTKEKTVYSFNASNQLASMRDRNGNETQYIYNGAGLLTKIVDPVGLETTFTYTNGRVTQITDPANRVTQLKYDSQGNLVQIIDPDESKRTWEYDSAHHMISETDERGNTEQAFYDFAGRAEKAIRKDGSVVEVNPVQTQGLYRPEETSNPQLISFVDNLIITNIPSPNSFEGAKSGYVDGNGDVIERTLDGGGQTVSASDGVGALPSVERTEENLVNSRTNAGGNTTEYEYDERGNVISIIDPISRALQNQDYEVGESPVAVATGDVDGNGTLDIVTANSDGESFSVLLGHGNGLFEPNSIDYPVGFNPSLLTLGDLNNDGWLDLVASKNDQSVSVLLGGENGFISGSTDYQVGGTPSLLTLGDLDNDGWLDLITGNNNSSVSVLRGSENGFVSGSTDYQVGGTPSLLNLGDLNNDGWLDLVTSNNNASISVILNNEGNSLNNVVNVDLDKIPGYLSLQDINNQGSLDIVTDVSLLLDLENNSFTQVNLLSNSEVAIGDIDGDDEFDAVDLGTGEIYLNYDLNNQVKQDVPLGYEATRSEILQLELGYLTDVDGDADLDLIGINYKNNFNPAIPQQDLVEVWLNDSQGYFTLGNTYLLEDTNFGGDLDEVDFTVADLDDDSKLDLIFYGDGIANENHLIVFFGNQDGSWSNGGEYQFKSSSLNTIQADLDEDSNLDDITVNSSDNNVTVSLFSPLQRTFTYDPVFNQLTSTTDELGRQTLYDIDPNNGNTLSVTRVIGKLDSQSNENDDVITHYTYTDAGLVDTITDPVNIVTDYDYDVNGMLTQITFTKGTADEAFQQFEYDQAGNRTAFIDENGNRTDYFLNLDNNRLLQLIEADPDGVNQPLTRPVTTFTYDEVGKITSITDPRGNTTTYAYDELDRRYQVIAADPDGVNGSLTALTTNYEYDDGGNVVGIIEAYSQGNQIIQRETENQYDSRGRLIATIDPEGSRIEFEYDLDNNLTAVIDSLGNRTSFFYDARNRLRQEIDPLGTETFYDYDVVNNLVGITDRNGNTTNFEYDDLNRLQARTNALNGVVQYTYNGVGNLLSTIDELGRTTEFDYDNRHRLTTITNPLPLAALEPGETNQTTFTYDQVGNLLSTTDQLNRTTTYTYDGLHRQIQVIDPLSRTTSSEYDSVGNLVAWVDELGHRTTYGYDGLHRLIESTNPLNDTISYEYDGFGNLIAFVDELQRRTQYEHDLRGRQTRIIDPEGNQTDFEYDSNGNLIGVTDGNGNTTHYGYDELNRQISITDALNQVTNYTYDGVGNLLSLTDPVNNTTLYTYDQLHRLSTDTNELGKARTYTYDGVSNLKTITDRNGRVREFFYDELNRQSQEVWLDGSGNPLHTINYDYDAASQLQGISDSHGTYGYEYDAVGRLILVDNNGTPGVPQVSLDYHYNTYVNERGALNYLVEVNDTVNGQLGGTESAYYDELNRVVRLTQTGNGVTDKRVDLAYDKAGQLDLISRYSDLTGVNLVAQSDYEYDLAGRLTDLTHQRGNQIIADYGWVYDQGNRVTSFTSPDGTSVYNYDESNQLTSTNHTYQTDENYSYDANGNRTNPGYETQTNNRLVSDGTYTYQYDDEGNRTQRTEIATGEVTEYEWDYRNRLTKVVTKDSNGNVIKEVEYTYDALDRRIAKAVDSDGDGAVAPEVERYVYDGDHIYLVFDGDGNQTQRFFHGEIVDQVFAQEGENGEVLWALTDNLGSVRDVVDNDGDVVNHIVYDSFGNIVSETDESVDFRFGYTGREFDEETGQYYYRARYYDATVGRFISEDPIGFAAGDGNLSRYVGNSPTNFTDPSGNRSVPARPPVRSPRRIPTIPSQPRYNQSSPNNVPSGYPFPLITPDSNPYSPSIPVNPTCISAPGVPCNPEQLNSEDSDDWFEKIKRLLEEIEERNQDDSEENSCPAPSASHEDSDSDSSPQNSGNNSRDEITDEMWDGMWDGMDDYDTLEETWDLAVKIAYGHAWTKHRDDFPEFKDEPELAQHINNIINEPSDSKDFDEVKKAYWDNRSGTVVIHDPDHDDKGTAFKPDRGKAYFDEL